MKRSNIRDVDVSDLEHVDGGIAIGSVMSVLPANGVPAVALNTGAPQGFPVPGGSFPGGGFPGGFPGGGFPGGGFWMEGHHGHGEHGGWHGEHGGWGHGDHEGGGWHEGGWHHGGHGGGHVMHELFQDPAVQGALQQFAGQHPEMAGVLENVQEGHGLFGLMHQPEGRALIGQFFQDPAFAGALQQFSTAHPELAGRVEHMLARIESRAAEQQPRELEPVGQTPEDLKP